MGNYIIRMDCDPERLVTVGPLVPGSWSREYDPLGREIRGEFLLDTGAFGAMIDLGVAEMLQLSMLGTKDIHGIHGYGRLQLYGGRVSLAAVDESGRATLYSTLIECVGVPSLRDQNREQRAEVIGILGRQFLREAILTVNHAAAKLELILRDEMPTGGY